MIIDFTISNFRSIKEKQTFSMLAEGAANHLKENVAYPNEDNIGVLRTVGIYGANASGKSNLLLAIEALRFIICKSGDLKDGESIPCYEPYLLSSTTKNQPTLFEIEFFVKSLRFLYSVSFNTNRVLSESLNFYPSSKPANLFNRKEDDTWEDIPFGSHYKGGKKRHAFFENNSYLSKAGNSADAPEIIRSVFNYFRNDIFHLGSEETVQLVGWRDNSEMVTKVANVLSSIDTGISDLVFEDIDESSIRLPKDIPESLKNRIISLKKKKPIFFHKDEDGRMEKFNENIESSGTMKLFNTLPMLIKAFEEGGVLFLDELDNSFHPHIAELLIKLFNDPQVNVNNAQLLFSTHNINLMSPKLLRRDQIWLTEKNKGATTFYSISEFDKSIVKPDSPYRRWYEDGRFGAIPNIDVGEIVSILTSGLKENA